MRLKHKSFEGWRREQNECPGKMGSYLRLKRTKRLTTAWPRQVIQGLDFLTCKLGIIIRNLTSVESKQNSFIRTGKHFP